MRPNFRIKMKFQLLLIFALMVAVFADNGCVPKTCDEDCIRVHQKKHPGYPVHGECDTKYGRAERCYCYCITGSDGVRTYIDEKN